MKVRAPSSRSKPSEAVSDLAFSDRAADTRRHVFDFLKPSVFRPSANTGSSLDGHTRSLLSRSTNFDLSSLRVHTHQDVASTVDRMGAQAVTIGRDLYFAPGAYAPHTFAGRELIAHEVGHVLQQTQQGLPRHGTRAAERDADSFAALVMAGHPARVAIGAPIAPAFSPKKTEAKPLDATTLMKRLDTLEDQAKQQKKQDAIRDKKLAALALDEKWRATFGERMASYKQAVHRVTGAIDMAEKGFQDAQIAQSQTDQLTTQLIGLGASFMFAGGFEWMVGRGLKAIGWVSRKIRNKVWQPDITKVTHVIEVLENPANAAFGGYMTNIRGAQQQQQDTAQIAADMENAEKVTEKGQKVTEKGQESDGPGGGAIAFLSGKSEALEKHWQHIEQAFIARRQKLDGFNDNEWLLFDVGAQESTYQGLLDELNASAFGVEKMEEKSFVAEVIEKYMWADWILHLAARQSGGGLHNFGTDINLRLIKLGVERQADFIAHKAATEFGLYEHWWQGNTDEWSTFIKQWASEYHGSILK